LFYKGLNKLNYKNFYGETMGLKLVELDLGPRKVSRQGDQAIIFVPKHIAKYVVGKKVMVKLILIQEDSEK